MEEYNEVEEYKVGTMHFMVCGLQLYLLLRGWDGVALIESALILLVIVRRRKSEALLDVDE
ncbi:hypothetical protein CASFOL_009351 [Castilleja foliolosa]